MFAGAGNEAPVQVICRRISRYGLVELFEGQLRQVNISHSRIVITTSQTTPISTSYKAHF